MDEPDNPLWRLAERRIGEAVRRGEFDDLPGSGRPLRLDDDSLVPEEFRVAFRLLKNAGYVPEEVRLRCEIGEIGALLAHLGDDGERLRATRRLELLRLRLRATRDEPPVAVEAGYRDRVLDRLAKG